MMYTFLLSLWANIQLKKTCRVRGEQWLIRLADIYASDPSSSVHGATGWLLTTWNQHDAVARVDQRELGYDGSGHREWFVVRAKSDNVEPNASSEIPTEAYFTFVVFQPETFRMGSPKDEVGRELDETVTDAKPQRAFAACDRETTWSQWMQWQGNSFRGKYSEQFGREIEDRHPLFGVHWFEAIGFCTWLTSELG